MGYTIRHGHFGFGPLIFSSKKREDQSQNDIYFENYEIIHN